MKKALGLTIGLGGMVALLVTACTTGISSEKPTATITQTVTSTPTAFEQSRQVAEAYVRNDPTFRFDGMEDTLKLEKIILFDMPYPYLDCEFVFSFMSRHSGYGDRTGQVLLQVITPHTVRITIGGGEVVRAVMDEKWDMMEQRMLVPVTEEQSQQIAESFVKSEATFRFDGMTETLNLVETVTLRCPYCWQFVFEFNSRHSGYGDRTGQVLAQVITPHTARVTVERGEVTHAVMDDKWDMMRQTLI